MAVLFQLLLATTTLAAPQTRERLASSRLAHVYGFTLPPGSRAGISASTGHGLVWVAITKGIIGVSEPGVEVREGTVDRLEGKISLTLQAPTGAIAKFVVVDVLDAFQSLTLSGYGGIPAVGERYLVNGYDVLKVGQVIEQASAQNDTLIIALGSVKLQDVWNLARGEDLPWRPSKPVMIELHPGGVQWTRPGVHRFKNMADTPASFVMVEW